MMMSSWFGGAHHPGVIMMMVNGNGVFGGVDGDGIV